MRISSTSQEFWHTEVKLLQDYPEMSVWAAPTVGLGDCRADPPQGRRFLEEGYVCEKPTSCRGTTIAELAFLGVQQCFTVSLRWTADWNISTRRDSLSLPEPCLTDAEVKMVYL